MLNKFNETYQDRGTIKWMGMYLSEHTASLEAEKKKLMKVVPVKPRMSSEDIEKVIDTAILRSSLVAIQLEAVDDDGNYSEDIIGELEGYDELGFWVDGQLVEYDSIRNIQEYAQLKWSFIDNE
ncbi:hypothetical protein R6Z02_17340 [Carnobacterium maltaromaticum]|uniref:hypothetical protein n=1 Tax=Carnobacterium maltaromaticum TaxID=2751 RepID=UPI00298B7875|nr:hypothetical protein [Carnobacterium maltaromaticum]MDW5525503.1 hypothetical protein [Carnobacterium maltaromaticum]